MDSQELQVEGPWFLLDDRTAVCPLCGASINHYYRHIHVKWHLAQQREDAQDETDKYRANGGRAR